MMTVRSREDAERILIDHWGIDSSQERLIVMLLDDDSRFLGSYLCDVGISVLRRVSGQKIVGHAHEVEARHVVFGYFCHSPDGHLSRAQLLQVDYLSSICSRGRVNVFDVVVIDGLERS